MLGEGQMGWGQAGVTLLFKSYYHCTGQAVRCGAVDREAGEITPDRARSANLTTTPTGCQGRKSIVLNRDRHSRGGGLSWASHYLWDTERVTQPQQASMSSSHTGENTYHRAEGAMCLLMRQRGCRAHSRCSAHTTIPLRPHLVQGDGQAVGEAFPNYLRGVPHLG